MKLTKKQVEYTAGLARLGLDKKEIKKFQKDLSDVLDFFAKLQEVKTDRVEPIAHITGLENVTRPDRARSGGGNKENLLDLAPETKNGFIKVKNIL